MSALIGHAPPDLVPNTRGRGAVVHASAGGVEVTSDHSFTLTPIDARNYAALLMRAADEVERMRRRMGR